MAIAAELLKESPPFHLHVSLAGCLALRLCLASARQRQRTALTLTVASTRAHEPHSSLPWQACVPLCLLVYGLTHSCSALQCKCLSYSAVLAPPLLAKLQVALALLCIFVAHGLMASGHRPPHLHLFAFAWLCVASANATGSGRSPPPRGHETAQHSMSSSTTLIPSCSLFLSRLYEPGYVLPRASTLHFLALHAYLWL